jgi:hypothetical protein
MLHELCNPVTMKLMALGRPLHEAERLAAVIVVWVVLLYAMMGYTLSIEGIPRQVRDRWSRPGWSSHESSSRRGMCGILPVVAGIAVGQGRTLLQR